MARQDHHERNQTPAVRPESVEGLVQGLSKVHAPNWLASITLHNLKELGRILNGKEKQLNSHAAFDGPFLAWKSIRCSSRVRTLWQGLGPKFSVASIEKRSAHVKILHTDTDDLENPLRGGQPVRTYQINSRLTQEHEITVLTATYPNCLRQKVRAGIRYRRLGIRVPGWGLSPHLSYLACLPGAVRRIPHDLLIEEFTPPVGFCMLPLWTRKPVISMVQWFFFRDWERRYKLPFEKMMRGLGRRGAYRNFIVQTDLMGDYFRELLPQSSIWTVPCGIAGDAFHASTGAGDYALFLGRLDINHKGLDYLIEAWRRLACADVRIPLKIVGAGPAEVWLREQISRYHLGDLIEMVGRVEGAAKEVWLRGCRFLVMPSRQETFGLTALEAMAASRPVLAFDIDHLNEVVRPPWGELAKLGDVDDLVRRASYLWHEPAHAKALGERGHVQAHAYRWDAIARRQLEIYQEVVCKERRT